MRATNRLRDDALKEQEETEKNIEDDETAIREAQDRLITQKALVPTLREKQLRLSQEAETTYAAYEKLCPNIKKDGNSDPSVAAEAAPTANNSPEHALECLISEVQSNQATLDGCFGNLESGGRDVLNDLFGRVRMAVRHNEIQRVRGPYEPDFGDLVPFAVAAQIQADEGAALAEQSARDVFEAMAADSGLDSNTKAAVEKSKSAYVTATK